MVPKKVTDIRQIIDRQPDVLYLGDSVLESVSSKDKNHAPLPEMLASRLGDTTLDSIYRAAYHAGLFLEICRSAVKKNKAPKVVLASINLRSFSPGWSSRPEYQFEDIKVFLRYDSLLFRIFYKPLGVFNAYDLTPISHKTFESLPVLFQGKEVGTVWDYTNEDKFRKVSDSNLKQKFLFHYLTPLSSTHPFLRAFAKLSKILKKENVRLILYLTPLDCETGRRQLGPLFDEVVSNKLDTIKKTLGEAGVHVLDFSCSIPANQFDWRANLYPNEHLNEKGRAYVADQLASVIKAK